MAGRYSNQVYMGSSYIWQHVSLLTWWRERATYHAHVAQRYICKGVDREHKSVCYSLGPIQRLVHFIFISSATQTYRLVLSNHKFMIPGHLYLPNDRDFRVVEQASDIIHKFTYHKSGMSQFVLRVIPIHWVGNQRFHGYQGTYKNVLLVKKKILQEKPLTGPLFPGSKWEKKILWISIQA